MLGRRGTGARGHDQEDDDNGKARNEIHAAIDRNIRSTYSDHSRSIAFPYGVALHRPKSARMRSCTRATSSSVSQAGMVAPWAAAYLSRPATISLAVLPFTAP